MSASTRAQIFAALRNQPAFGRDNAALHTSGERLHTSHVAYFELLATWVGSSDMGFFSVGGDLYDKCPKFKLALNIIGLLISATGLALGFYFDIYAPPPPRRTATRRRARAAGRAGASRAPRG